MGRSARQRRLKSVDPFNPKRGQILAAQRNPDGKDLAPNDKKEKKHIPRALREMMMGQKKIEEFEAKKKAKKHAQATLGSGNKVKQGSKPAAASASAQSASSKSAATAAEKSQTAATPASAAKKDPHFQGMQPGESFEQFNRRIKKETHDMLIEENKKSSRKLEKRKEFRAKRKEKLLKKRKRSDDSDDEQDDEADSNNANGDGAADGKPPRRTVSHFSQLTDQVKFGEQAYEPPKFARLPRGAMPPTKKLKTSGLAVADLLQNGPDPAEKRAMDLLRERIRNQLGAKKAAAQPSLSTILRG